MNLTYPITCCNVGNIFTTNWNDLPFSEMERVGYCAVNGTNLYNQVRLFNNIILDKNLFFFRVVMINL